MNAEMKSVKILLVEDFAFTRKMQTGILRELGFTRFAEAANGEEAIRQLEKEGDIGLIISDWNMPGMNGYELLKKIRSDEKYRHIPFIMATAQGEYEQASKALTGGADQFITKPFSPEDLQEVIRPLLAEKKKGNGEASQPRKVNIAAAHIQITDHLALGVLDHMIASGIITPHYFNLQTECMPGWNPVRSALEKGEVDAALLLAPLAMNIFSAGVPIRLVLLAHKNGSICVQNKDNDLQTSLHDSFKSKVFLLPHTMSVHHMMADMFLGEIGLKLGPAGFPGVDVVYEVVPPVNMPELIENNECAGGFAVAEPIGSKTIASGAGKLLFYSGSLWENHPCCVVVMRQEFIDKHPEAAGEFTRMMVQAGRYIEENPKESSEIAVRFLDPDGALGFEAPLLRDVLTQPGGIRTDDLFPVVEDLDRMQQYMHDRMGVGKLIDLEKFIDIRFAKAAYQETPPVTGHSSTIHPPAGIVTDIVKKRMTLNCEKAPAAETEALLNAFRSTREENRLTFKIASDMELVNRVIQETKEFLIRLGFSVFSGMNLILRELLINAVEHGNQFSREKYITCTLLHMRDSLFKVTVADEGKGFDYTALEMTIPENKQQVRKRGYPFINAFSEAIEFNETGNQITVFHKIYDETRFDVEEQGNEVVIRPSGDITAARINELRVLLKQVTDKGYTAYRFDFTDVEDIDSMGFSAFVILARMISERDKNETLEIINANAEIRGLFRMTHLDGAYRINEGGI